MVVTFVVLTFVFSSVFWYLASQTPQVSANAFMLTLYVVGSMWCPALAAVITRLVFQRNLKGFHTGPGKFVWLAAGILIPIAVGLAMFSSAWLSGIAPFYTENAVVVFSFAFIPVFLYSLVFNLFAAAGEEFGWRGFLVPELGRFQGFTVLALLSGAIWTVWHFPMIFFGTYHGTGSILSSLAVFVPSVMGAGVVLAWLRLMSGSVWPAVLFHGFWNYFIQSFYPALTVTTDAGQAMLGEFGWFCAAAYVILALVFWHFRDRLPKLPAENV
ncbi:MAG: CPBP family intramembrane glutamic endopeptidase [Methanoregulaceae archaeon]